MQPLLIVKVWNGLKLIKIQAPTYGRQLLKAKSTENQQHPVDFPSQKVDRNPPCEEGRRTQCRVKHSRRVSHHTQRRRSL